MKKSNIQNAKGSGRCLQRLVRQQRYPHITALNKMMPFYWKLHYGGYLTLGETYEKMLSRIETMLRLGDITCRRQSSVKDRESR